MTADLSPGPTGPAPLRAAVIGLDSAFWPAAFHDAIVGHPELEMAGMCSLGLAKDVVQRDFVADPDEWMGERGLTRIDSLDEMLDVGFDVGFVCTRNTVMPELCERLIGLGKHLYVAKPLALTASDARRFLRARDAGVVVTAGQTASAWAPWPAIRSVVDSGRIGRVLTMRAFHHHGHYDAFPPQLWYADPAEGDATNWLGWYPVEAVVATMQTRVATVCGVSRQLDSAHGDMPDTLHAVLTTDDGRLATVQAQFTVRPEWAMGMHGGEVFGDQGVVSHDPTGDTVRVAGANGVEDLPAGDPIGVAGEAAMLVDAIRGRGAPAIEVEQAVHVAEICAAWRESARRGGAPVEVGTC